MDISYQIASGKGFGPHGIGLTPRGSNGMPAGSCPGVRAPVFLVHHPHCTLFGKAARGRLDARGLFENSLQGPYINIRHHHMSLT